MERLTERKRNFNGTAISKKSMIDREGYPTVSDYASKVLTKLATYEDAEEQGLLLRLPCKLGDTVYIIIAKSISKQRVKEIIIDGYGIKFKTKRRVFGLCDVFYTVFLTKAEAEAKLKELRGA